MNDMSPVITIGPTPEQESRFNFVQVQTEFTSAGKKARATAYKKQDRIHALYDQGQLTSDECAAGIVWVERYLLATKGAAVTSSYGLRVPGSGDMSQRVLDAKQWLAWARKSAGPLGDSVLTYLLGNPIPGSEKTADLVWLGKQAAGKGSTGKLLITGRATVRICIRNIMPLLKPPR